MNTYLITYDLNSPGQKYECISKKIKDSYSWWKCLNNIFIIKSDNSSSQIRDFLKPCIDSNDKLIVLKLSGEGAWKGFDEKCSNWLKNNL